MKGEVRWIQARIWSPLRQLCVGVAFKSISSFIRRVLAPWFCLLCNMFQALCGQWWRWIFGDWYVDFVSHLPVTTVEWGSLDQSSIAVDHFITLFFLRNFQYSTCVLTPLRTQSWLRSFQLSVATDSNFCSQQPPAYSTYEVLLLRRLVLSLDLHFDNTSS